MGMPAQDANDVDKIDNDLKAVKQSKVDASKLPKVDAPSKRLDGVKKLARLGCFIGFAYTAQGCPAADPAVELNEAPAKAADEADPAKPTDLPKETDEKAPADLPKETEEAPVK